MRLEERLIQLCRDSHLTLGAAESCTGGAFSARITQVPGASDVFLGAIVSYSNQVKQRLLDVKPETLKLAGMVSAGVSQEMLKGAIEKLGCTLAVAITGIAGPTGGTPLTPIGTVWISVGGQNFKFKTKCLNLQGTRVEIIQKTVDFSIEQLIEMVEAA